MRQVMFQLLKSGLLASERRPFRLQEAAFWKAKGIILVFNRLHTDVYNRMNTTDLPLCKFVKMMPDTCHAKVSEKTISLNRECIC